ncbi:uncharacterized protein C8R40DRAFT_1071833 [Lentinula edodes]|uniref:uncharacterized protein n=1 Tax=Lentinula edodes TaxID=5353 RepID=UPI001E8EDC04|nr:uncharacterized protein C8R40DRAFT_1071833 [Lentinula edodes]KAH7872344.1 hypothetical protein C8R40DRAFT_1071833 [Lentinula edodes]
MDTSSGKLRAGLPELGITNGARGFLRKLELVTDNNGLTYCKYALVEFPDSKVQLAGLPKGYFPIKSRPRSREGLFITQKVTIDDLNFPVVPYDLWFEARRFEIMAHNTKIVWGFEEGILKDVPDAEGEQRLNFSNIHYEFTGYSGKKRKHADPDFNEKISQYMLIILYRGDLLGIVVTGVAVLTLHWLYYIIAIYSVIFKTDI